MVTLPVWCACGKIVRFSNETRCEDCFAVDQQKYDGKSRHVDTPFFSAAQSAQHEARTQEINGLLKGGLPNVRATQAAPRHVGGKTG